MRNCYAKYDDCDYTLGIGDCLIGEFISKEIEVKRLLSIDNEELQLMGIVLFGYACCEVINIGEKEIEEFIIYKFE